MITDRKKHDKERKPLETSQMRQCGRPVCSYTARQYWLGNAGINLQQLLENFEFVVAVWPSIHSSAQPLPEQWLSDEAPAILNLNN